MGRLNLISMGVALISTAAIVWQLQYDDHIDAEFVISPPQQQPTAPLPVFRPPPDSVLAAATHRPLFASHRRPDPVQIEYSTDSVNDDPPNINLTAVSISKDGRIAVVKDIASGNTVRVAEGKKIGDWTITNVFPDRIVLERNHQQSSVPLFRPSTTQEIK